MVMRTRELQKHARRRAILDAARALILEDKARDFSMPELAEKAGVSLVTPYNLFGSKSHILLEIVREDIFEPVQAIGDLACDSLGDWIAELSATLARIYYRNRHFYRRMIVTLVAQENAEVQRESLALNYGLFEAVLVRLDAQRKIVPIVSPETLAKHLTHGVSGALQERLMERGSEQALCDEIEMSLLLLMDGVALPADRQQIVQRVEALDKTRAKTFV
jgi:AcrR family transcriptional regulator